MRHAGRLQQRRRFEHRDELAAAKRLGAAAIAADDAIDVLDAAAIDHIDAGAEQIGVGLIGVEHVEAVGEEIGAQRNARRVLHEGVAADGRVAVVGEGGDLGGAQHELLVAEFAGLGLQRRRQAQRFHAGARAVGAVVIGKLGEIGGVGDLAGALIFHLRRRRLRRAVLETLFEFALEGRIVEAQRIRPAGAGGQGKSENGRQDAHGTPHRKIVAG